MYSAHVGLAPIELHSGARRRRRLAAIGLSAVREAAATSAAPLHRHADYSRTIVLKVINLGFKQASSCKHMIQYCYTTPMKLDRQYGRIGSNDWLSSKLSQYEEAVSFCPTCSQIWTQLNWWGRSKVKMAQGSYAFKMNNVNGSFSICYHSETKGKFWMQRCTSERRCWAGNSQQSESKVPF